MRMRDERDISFEHVLTVSQAVNFLDKSISLSVSLKQNLLQQSRHIDPVNDLRCQ
jgi:hypothetical protein